MVPSQLPDAPIRPFGRRAAVIAMEPKFIGSPTGWKVPASHSRSVLST